MAAQSAGTAYVDLEPRFGGGWTRGVEGAATQAGKAGSAALTREFQRSNAGFSTIQRNASGVGTAIAGAFAVTTVARFADSVVDAGSDLTESQSKVNVVFKEGADDVEEWGKRSATAMGISRREALESSSTLGNLLISMGLIPQAAQDMSVELVELASDLASFNNTSPEDALLAIRSGLVGEIEPLRRYGVSLSAARIEQEGMAQGINKSNAEMTAAEKATLAYQIILQDTALAQGDFERTSDGLANQQRIMSARWEDMKAQLGQGVIPLLLTTEQAALGVGHGIGVANDVTGGWLGTMAKAAVVGGGLALAVTKGGQALAFTGGWLQNSIGLQNQQSLASQANARGWYNVSAAQVAAGDAFGQTSTRLQKVGAALGAVGAGLVIGTEAANFYTDLVGRKQNVDELTASLLALNKGEQDAFDLSDFQIDDVAEDNWANRISFKGLSPDAVQAKVDVEALNGALSNVLQIKGVDAAWLAYGRLQQQWIQMGGDVTKLAGLFDPFLGKLHLAEEAQDDTSASARGLGQTFADLANNQLLRQGAQLSIADSFDKIRDAEEALAEARDNEAGTGEEAVAAAEQEASARDRVTSAIESQQRASENLADARAELAEFDSPTDTRIRELERLQIVDRVVEDPQDARQKEIDLLQFDESTKDRREDLLDRISDAERGVADAAEGVADAQAAVAEASENRRQVQVDNARAVDQAERDLKQTVIEVGIELQKAADAGLINNQQLRDYLERLDDIADKTDPGGVLAKNLDGIIHRMGLADLIEVSQDPRGPVGPGEPEPFVGTPGFGPGGFLGPVSPQGPAGAAAGPQSVTHIDARSYTTIKGGDRPTREEIDVNNRKQAKRLNIAGRR